MTLNPSSARRIEVVRGPATLLYGANAIGGSGERDHRSDSDVPTSGVSGDVTLDLASNSGQAGGAGDVHCRQRPLGAAPLVVAPGETETSRRRTAKSRIRRVPEQCLQCGRLVDRTNALPGRKLRV